MNSSELWADSFKSQLNCVSCRSYEKPLKLYFTSSRQEVHPSEMTIEQLNKQAPYMDAWCDDCEVRTSFHVRTKGRATRRQEAADFADIVKKPWFDITSRQQVLDGLGVIRKQDFYNAAKDFPCTMCGKSYSPYCMEFNHHLPKYKSLARMASDTSDINTMILEMEKCSLVCANCHRYYQYSGESLPLLLWKYEDHKDRILSILAKT